MYTTPNRILLVTVTAGLCLGVGQPVAGQAPPTSTGPAYSKADLVAGYQVDPTWPQKPAAVKWAEVPGLAADAKGRIWMINRGEIPVQIYGPDGAFLGGWGQGRFKAIHQIRFDHQGDVWISDTGQHTVRKFTPAGELLLTLGTPDKSGEDERHFNKPTDMAIAPSGDVFVSDGYGNSRVVHFDRRGRFVKSWGKMGIAPGEFNLPHSIVMDSAGRLYVAERNNARIQVFDQTGKPLGCFPQIMVPWTLFITPEDHVFACGSSPMRWDSSSLRGTPPKDQLVVRFDTQGRVQELWTFPLGLAGKEQAGELNWLHGVAVDSRGNLYLGDIQGRRAQKFVRLPPAEAAESARRDKPIGITGRVSQAHAVLTVSEGKRLIAKAVARMPIVQAALRDGLVIVCKGTTNTYVAEELLGKQVPHGSFVTGRVTPKKGGEQLPRTEAMPEVVLIKGQHRPDLSLDEALRQLSPGDVVIKGGNALDYDHQTVGVWHGSATGGTTGKILPAVAAHKAHLIIPVGLEKQVAGTVTDIVDRINEPVDDLAGLPRMRILPGQVVTEIEALKMLADVEAFQASAGGIGGAEGAVWIVWRGTRGNVEKARSIVDGIQGEPPFVAQTRPGDDDGPHR